MNELNDYLRKMEALVKDDCKLHVPSFRYIRCYSYAVVSGNIEAHFDVAGAPNYLWLYDVIYIQQSNKFCTYRYRLEDTFVVDNVTE
nr:MAG TPA: hypothetical protein [Caudoviricetes sp.]